MSALGDTCREGDASRLTKIDASNCSCNAKGEPYGSVALGGEGGRGGLGNQGVALGARG